MHIADSGYAPSAVILQPCLNAVENSLEARFTNKLTKIRSQMENVNGILKEVCRCISKERRLHYRPKKAARIVMASVILHNFRKLNW